LSAVGELSEETHQNGADDDVNVDDDVDVENEEDDEGEEETRSDTRQSICIYDTIQLALLLTEDSYNNNGFICIAARMLDYTVSVTQDSAYNITQIVI